MNTRNIVYIHMKETGEDLFYSSMKTFFDNVAYDEVKITNQAVKNYMSENKTNIYENEKIKIIKSVMILDKRKERPDRKKKIIGLN